MPDVILQVISEILAESNQFIGEEPSLLFNEIKDSPIHNNHNTSNTSLSNAKTATSKLNDNR